MIDHPDDCTCELCRKNLGRYYNTNLETGATLIKSRKTVGKQEDRVYEYFQARPGQKITRHQIERDMGLLQSSAVRSLRNLVLQGKLIKIENKDEMVMEVYGKMVHTWMLAPPPKPKGEQRPLF